MINKSCGDEGSDTMMRLCAMCHSSSWEISLTQVTTNKYLDYLEVAESLPSAGLLSSALPADLGLDGHQDVPVAAVQGDGGGPGDQSGGGGGQPRPHQQQHQQHLQPRIRFCKIVSTELKL